MTAAGKLTVGIPRRRLAALPRDRHLEIKIAVLELFDLAGECGGDYDGWKTKVESIT